MSNIGYACLTVGVADTNMRRCNLSSATDDILRNITKSNIEALSAMVDYNIKSGIKLFRISSDIIPFGSHEMNKLNWRKEFAEELSDIGGRIRDNYIRVSMHPGQYTVLNAPDTSIAQRAVADLCYHNEFLDAIGVDKKCKLVLHIGGVYNNKEESKKRFAANYKELPKDIRSRLVIENDDKSYNIEDLLEISKITGIPVVFDNLHNKINPAKKFLSENDWIKLCKSTWDESHGPQKIHYSQQKEGASVALPFRYHKSGRVL